MANETKLGAGKSRIVHLPNLDHAAVERPDEQGVLVRSLLAAAEVTQPAPVVVGGPGGFGKTTLALQVCRDARVAGRFDAILWTEPGQECTPARVIQLVADLCEQLQGDRPTIASPEQAGFRMAEALGERRALLVIDNVWASADLAPLLLGGPNCVRLVTTRNLAVCRARSSVVQVPPMSDAEIVGVLRNNSSATLERVVARRLADLCGGWPLLASIVGASVAQDVDAGASEVEAIERVCVALREDGPESLDVWDSGQREGTIGRALLSSLRSLDANVVVHGNAHLGERYLDLTVFPAAVPIPLSVLHCWWGREHGWTMATVRQFVRILAERSLIGSYRADDDAIVLHDVFRSSLTRLARRPAVEAHKSLIAAFRGLAPAGFSELPTDQSYVWRYLTHHLDQAGYSEEAISVLAEPAFIVTKMCHFGHEPLIDDALALESAGLRATSSDVGLARSLVSASYLAADMRRSDDVAATLLVGLGWAGLLDSAAGESLRAWSGEVFDVSWAVPRVDEGDGHTGAVTAVAATDERLVSAGEDGSVRVWDRASHRLLQVLRGHHGWVYAVAVSPDGEVIASAGDDLVIRLWSASSGALAGVLAGHEKRIRSLAFDRAGGRLVSGGEDGEITVWSVAPSARLHDLDTDASPVWSVAVGHNDSLIAAGGEDEIVRIYDLDNGRLLAERAGHRDWIRSVAFSEVSPLLASGSGDGSVTLWNVADGHLAPLRTTQTPARVRALTVSPDAGEITAAGEDAVVRVISASGVTHEIPAPPGVDWIRALADAGHGEMVLGCEDGAVRLLREHRMSDAAVGCDTVWSTALTPDAGIALLGRSDGSIEANRADSNATVRRFSAGHGRVWALTAAAGYVAAACGDGAVRAWSIEDDWSLTLDQNGSRTWAVAIHPAGTLLAASSGAGTMQVWDLRAGNLIWQQDAHAGRVRSIAFDPTGRLLVTGGGDGAVRTWESSTGKRLTEVRNAAGWVRTVGVSQDSTRIAVGLGSGDLSVHDTTPGRAVIHLFGHTGRVLAASWADENELLTAASDGTVRLWSLSDRRQLAQVRLDASLQCAHIHGGTGSVLAGSSAGVVALRLRRSTEET